VTKGINIGSYMGGKKVKTGGDNEKAMLKITKADGQS